MIAGVIPLGLGMEKTGTAAFLAQQLQEVTVGWSPLAVMLALYWAAALVTQILSDAATTVLLGPISLALALALGLPPQPFIVCTALGAVTAFLTPIGHHGNLLILNPGQYTFGDFFRVGVPLTICISLVSAWLAQYLWLGGPLLPTWLGGTTSGLIALVSAGAAGAALAPGSREYVQDKPARHDAGEPVREIVGRRDLDDVHADDAIAARHRAQERRELAEINAAGRRRHDRRHLGRVEPVGVDREVDRAALRNRREHRVHALGMDLLGAEQVRAEGAGRLRPLSAARCRWRAGRSASSRKPPSPCSPTAAGSSSRGARRRLPRASRGGRRCAGCARARRRHRARRRPGS